MVVSVIQICKTLNTWFWNPTSSQRVAIEKSESTMLVLPPPERKPAWTRKSQSWKFAQTMFLKDLERRESGSWELKPLTTKLTKEPWVSVNTTRVDQSLILKSRTGAMVTQRTWDPIQLGRMTDMTQLSIHMPIDMITWTSQNKNIKMFSEVP